MRQIVYTSRARAAFDASGLQALLEQAQGRNAAAGVTGLLVFHDGHFFQAIEGPDAAVQEIYRRIRADRRHDHVHDLVNSPIARREFGEWSMGRLEPDHLAADGADFLRRIDLAAQAGSQASRTQLILGLFAQGRWRDHVAA